uniref:Uncharacterized protein n=1 Tax=Alexandrium andersonii TaxID=327968 RepID=A0A7S2AZG2_9DINO
MRRWLLWGVFREGPVLRRQRVPPDVVHGQQLHHGCPESVDPLRPMFSGAIYDDLRVGMPGNSISCANSGSNTSPLGSYASAHFGADPRGVQSPDGDLRRR